MRSWVGSNRNQVGYHFKLNGYGCSEWFKVKLVPKYMITSSLVRCLEVFLVPKSLEVQIPSPTLFLLFLFIKLMRLTVIDRAIL